METNRGNVTGLEGDFSVEATPGQTLSVSFLGYNTQQIKVGSQTSFDITLTEDSKQISEVLVVGYTPMQMCIRDRPPDDPIRVCCSPRSANRRSKACR